MLRPRMMLVLFALNMYITCTSSLASLFARPLRTTRWQSNTMLNAEAETTTNDNYETPKNPHKVRLAKSNRLFNMDSAPPSSVLEDIEKVVGECISTSLSKFEEGASEQSNAKVQMGSWIEQTQLDQVVRVMNNTVIAAAAAATDKAVFRRDTMQLLKINMLPSTAQPKDFSLYFFHVPAFAMLPARKHKEGTIVIYKALYGSGKLEAYMEDGRRFQNDALVGPTSLIIASATDFSGSILFRIGGPRRVFKWDRMIDSPTATRSFNDEPGSGAPASFLELALYPPFAASDEILIDEEEAIRELYPSASDLSSLLTTTTLAAASNYEKIKIEENNKNKKGDRKYSDVYTDLQRRIGGLDSVLQNIVRRVLKSRSLPPKTLTALGLSHVRGLLLYGPPGTGKTLLAREIARSLNARVKIVNGPELLDKYVGEAERNVRLLFAEADEEWDRYGYKSELHVIILDELDSVAKRRGSSFAVSEGNGVRESVVNQLLSKLDGVVERNNVLIIGMTNRKDLIDDALLRPGRLEVHIEVKPPDRTGRRTILWINMKDMVRSGFVDIEQARTWADRLSKKCVGFTGADLAGVVRSAASFALTRWEEEVEGDREKEAEEEDADDDEREPDMSKLRFEYGDFERALKELNKRPSIRQILAERFSSILKRSDRDNGSTSARTLEDIVYGE